MDAGLLAAGKLVHGSAEVAFCKAQPLQYALQAALIAVSVVLFKVMLQFGIFFHLVSQGLSAQTAHFVFHFTKICLCLDDFFKNGQHFFVDRTVTVDVDILCQISDGCVFFEIEFAAVGRDLTGQNLE